MGIKRLDTKTTHKLLDALYKLNRIFLTRAGKAMTANEELRMRNNSLRIRKLVDKINNYKED